MNHLAESAAAYLRHQPALAAAVNRLDVHLQHCEAVLHPAAPVPSDTARATRRRVEAGLSNHLDTVPRGRIECKLSELPTRARTAKETVEARYNANC